MTRRRHEDPSAPPFLPSQRHRDHWLCPGRSAQLPLRARASQIWDGGGANGIWSNVIDWLGDIAAPGDTVSTDNPDVGIFNAAIANTWGNAASNPIVIDPNRNLGGISFDLASGNYFIGSTTGNTLKVSSGGTIQILNTLTATNLTATINAPLQIQGPGGTYTFANNSANGSGAGAGTLNFGGGITGGAAGATVLTLDGSNTNANTVSGVIANGAATTLGVTKSGAGSWVLSGVNTYSGPTTINLGTLSVNSSAALGDGSATNTLIFNGGTLTATQSFTSPGTRGVTLNGTGTLNITAEVVTIAGVITGPGGLTKSGTGRLVLTGANDYTGVTTLSAGVLSVSALSDGSLPGNLGAATNAITNLVFSSSSTLRYTGATASTNRGFTINNGVAATFEVTDPAANLTLAGATAATTGALTMQGPGTLTLSGTKSYTGRTTVNGGTLAIALGAGGTNIVASTSALTLGGGTLQLTGTGSQTLAGLTTTGSTGSRIVLGSSQTLTLGALTSAGSASALNFNTAAGGANGATVGTGVIVLTGFAANVGFTVTDSGGFGLAAVNGSNQIIRLITTPLLPASGAVGTSYRLDNNPGGAAAAGSSTLAITTSEAAASITVDSTTASGAVTLGSGVLLSTDTWNFGGSGTSTNPWQISGSAGGAGVRSGTAGANIEINNYNTGKVTFLSPILANGTNAVSLKGPGTTVLAGANTYTGGTIVNGGTLEVPTGGSITHPGSGMIVGASAGDNATLNLSGTGSISNSYGFLGNGTGSSGTANVSGGTWTNSAEIYVGYLGNGVLNLSGTGSISNTGFGYVGTFAGSSGTANVSGGIWTNSSTLTVGYLGTGVLNLSGTGLIHAGGPGGTGTVSVGNQTGSSGTLNIGTGGAAGTLHAATVSGGSGTAVVNFNHTGSLSFAPQLAGSLSVNKLGSGTTTLTHATNNYTGPTTVTAGTLLVSGSISGSTTVSNAGSTLGGTGTVGNVTVNSGAILQGGDGVTATGALTSAGTVSLLDGSVIRLTLGLSQTHSSLARTGGAWTFDNDQLFTFNIIPGATAGFYNDIITGVTALQAANVGTWLIDPLTGVTGTFSYDGANVDLNVSVIPEPGSAALLLAGLPLLGLRRRRRR